MTVQGNQIYKGSFTSTGEKTIIRLSGDVNYFQIFNRTQWGANPNAIVKSEWWSGMANDTARNTLESGAGALSATTSTANGISFVDTANPPTFPAKAITSVSQANPANFNVVGHGLTAGDVFEMANVTGMLQIASYSMRVRSVVDPDNFTVFLDSSGFAAPGTGGTIRKTISPEFTNFNPDFDLITGIAQAATTTFTLAYNDVTTINVGEIYRVKMPADFGMTEIDGQLGTVLSVNAANNTVTLNIDSTTYTAFAFPASAAIPFSVPQLTPVGQTTATLAGATRNAAQFFVELGSDVVGSAADVMDWIAFKGEVIT